MANQITVSGSLNYANTPANIAGDSFSINNFLVSVLGANSGYAKNAYSFGTATATAVPLAGAGQGTLGWAAFKNNDPQNIVVVYTSSGGAMHTELLPGEENQFRFAPNITAPAIQCFLGGAGNLFLSALSTGGGSATYTYTNIIGPQPIATGTLVATGFGSSVNNGTFSIGAVTFGATGTGTITVAEASQVAQSGPATGLAIGTATFTNTTTSALVQYMILPY